MIEVLFTQEELRALQRGFAVIKDGNTYRAMREETEIEPTITLTTPGAAVAHRALQTVLEDEYAELSGGEKEMLIEEVLAIAKRTDTDSMAGARILARQFDGSRYGTLTAYAAALAGNR
jgi:hypothetical protein